jgi:rhodanese-related sulfurtransferase
MHFLHHEFFDKTRRFRNEVAGFALRASQRLGVDTKRHPWPAWGMPKSVDRMLAEARETLPHRPSPAETLRELESGTLVIDIRGDEQQRRDGMIAGALVIRRNVLEWCCDPASPWHHPRITGYDQKIVLVCNQGYQSSLAAANLQELGLTGATDMDGGFERWMEQGLPIVPYDADAANDSR